MGRLILNWKIITRWEGQGGVTITLVVSIQVLRTTPVVYKQTILESFAMNKFMFKPKLHIFIDVCGLHD